MTRCDYDAVFYRVFCVTLLAIAFTFTVILTNVFIDIDGLITSKKEKHTPRREEKPILDEFTSEATENDDMSYAETDENYRNKRSIETQSFLFHIKNPKVKNLLSHRLASLLEELETEETPEMKLKEKTIVKEKPKIIPKVIDKDGEFTVSSKLAEKKAKKLQEDEDMLHLTMHNILLQGIIGHMEMNEVYQRIHSLMDSFNDVQKNEKLASKPAKIINMLEEPPKLIRKPTENQFFEELIGCNELQNQVTDIDRVEKLREKSSKPNPNKENPEVMVKTVIDISALSKAFAKENDTKHPKENLKGVIEIVYNGKTFKFTHPDIETSQSLRKNDVIQQKPTIKIPIKTTTVKDSSDFNKIPLSILNKFVEEYFKAFPDVKEIKTDVKEENKRLKRHIKHKHYEKEKSKEKSKSKETEDDELYVEIETHFDSKGLKGEKKKKLIRSLVEKIQKAIHSDLDGKLVGTKLKSNGKSHQKLHFRKRTQNPLDHSSHVLVNKYALPINTVVHRELNPITKTVTVEEEIPNIFSKSGEEWKKSYIGPGFLAPSKSINSAEMSEVDVDYSKVLDANGVSPRLQKPLNTELSEETVNTNSFYDLGNMKFFIKDIDGSGFSVGYNQYVDEAPDQDTMKLFTGLENVIKTYHQNYDETTSEPNSNIEEKIPESLSDNQDHIIVRRSINKQEDYHSNEYKIIYDQNFLPYDNYRDLFTNRKKTKSKYDYVESSKRHAMPLIVDENIFEKNLNPAEIFGIANLLNRKKRSLNVKQISNLKSKIKLNRYINTKAMSTKKIFLKKKRNKRQINKIRIIATDLPHSSKHSDENIFVVSDENMFADRAIVKEVETSELDREKHEEDTEFVSYHPEEHISPTYVTKIFDGRSRHNPLMSKYPHIFMEEISRSGEDYLPDSPALLFSKLPSIAKMKQNVEYEKIADKYMMEQQSIQNTNTTEAPKLHSDHEIYTALGLPPPKATNYKVTVKIVPKNITGVNSGFKEIHTSINKRFNKNGMVYSSLVNVSEISKITKLNRSKSSESKIHDAYMTKKMKEQQEKMKLILKHHAQHIAEQLSRLNEEKTNLDTFIFGGDNKTDTFVFDDNMEDIEEETTKPPKVLHVNKDKTTKHTTETTKEETHTTVTSIRVQTPTVTSILTTTPAMFSDKVKNNIINTIERNENLTDQILKKIDKNTEILQTFLKKLTEKMDVQPRAVKEEVVKIKEEEKLKEEENKTKVQTNEVQTPFQHEWAHHGLQFNQNMVIRKNDSHISIPFVYAYQQPVMPHKRDTPIASVVYHGHIHTNAVHPKETENVKPIVPVQESNSNQSRFFIDELENDYKVIQVGDVNKGKDNNMINGTGIL